MVFIPSCILCLDLYLYYLLFSRNTRAFTFQKAFSAAPSEQFRYGLSAICNTKSPTLNITTESDRAWSEQTPMLSVGLCLPAGLPARFLVFLGLIGALGGINDCLIQFQLLPCGAVLPLDFFDHIVGVGSCDMLAQLFPAFLGFGVKAHDGNAIVGAACTVNE